MRDLRPFRGALKNGSHPAWVLVEERLALLQSLLSALNLEGSGNLGAEGDITRLFTFCEVTGQLNQAAHPVYMTRGKSEEALLA